jgi:hypothetical protein
LQAFLRRWISDDGRVGRCAGVQPRCVIGV